MKNTISKFQEIVNSEISKIKFDKTPKELYEPIKYIMQLKSKRFRPILTLMSYKLFKGDIDKVIKPSIAIEFFHNFTLIHDDIMDGADIRRGKKTIHKKWNNNIGILSGDLLMIFTYRMLEGLSKNNLKLVLKRFNEIAIKVCEGQQYDMNYENINLIDEANYLEMIKLKTAVLIGFSLELGGIIAEVDKNQSDILYQVGECMGIGFQLKDDYLDVFGNEKFGKKIGGDILLNKKTYLLIKLLELSNKKDREKIDYWMHNSNNPTEKVHTITSLMQKNKIDLITKKKMKYYFKKGINLLNKISSNNKNLNILSNYFEMMIDRKN
tara:strand:+ start:36 stop:1007 length:972 start_codon:yes stop_codon:yes gene_type:complete